jgi:hypothetical protein
MSSEIRVTNWLQALEFPSWQGFLGIFLQFASRKEAVTSRQAGRTDAETAGLSALFDSLTTWRGFVTEDLRRRKSWLTKSR